MKLNKKALLSFSDRQRLFMSLLEEIKSYQSFLSIFKDDELKEIQKFVKENIEQKTKLKKEQQQTRFEQFNNKYLNYLNISKKIERGIQKLNKKLASLSIDERAMITETKLKIEASESHLRQAQSMILLHSYEAHQSLARAKRLYKTIDDKKETEVKKEKKILAVKSKNTSPLKTEEIKKLLAPGKFRGRRSDRNETPENEKFNMTPIDTEFYEDESTKQLGDMLIRDLGTPASAWSYDFENDDLYVLSGENVGKIRVKENKDGVRILQTRIGSNFSDFPPNYQGDQRVDTEKSKGKFLTGEGDTLFGSFKAKKDKLLSEDKEDHSGHDHDHDHDHDH